MGLRWEKKRDDGLRRSEEDIKKREEQDRSLTVADEGVFDVPKRFTAELTHRGQRWTDGHKEMTIHTPPLLLFALSFLLSSLLLLFLLERKHTQASPLEI